MIDGLEAPPKAAPVYTSPFSKYFPVTTPLKGANIRVFSFRKSTFDLATSYWVTAAS